MAVDVIDRVGAVPIVVSKFLPEGFCELLPSPGEIPAPFFDLVPNHLGAFGHGVAIYCDPVGKERLFAEAQKRWESQPE